MQSIHSSLFNMKSNTLHRITAVVIISIAQLISGQDLSELENWSCTRPGLNSHPHDCHNFVLCLSTQQGLKPESIFTCPETFAFSKQERTCVHQDKVPGCTQNRQGMVDQDDGFSKRGPVGRSCKTNGVFCHNDNVLVVCTDTRIPVLVLDCRNLEDTPICDTISGTCRAEDLPDHITFKDPDMSEEEEEENKQEDEVEIVDDLEEGEKEEKVKVTEEGKEETGEQAENETIPNSLSSTLASLIERVVGAFSKRFARHIN